MHITLAIILGAAGALLIMVGVLGGGFTISTATVPKVGPVPRVVSFIVGGLLVLSSITASILEDPAAWSDPDTSVAAGSGSDSGASSGSGSGSSSSGYIAPVVTEPGFNVALFQAPSLSAPYAAGAEDGLADGQVVEILCTLQGDTVSFAGNTSSLWNGVSVENGVVGFIPDVYVDTGTFQPAMPNCETVWNENGAV